MRGAEDVSRANERIGFNLKILIPMPGDQTENGEGRVRSGALLKYSEPHVIGCELQPTDDRR